MATGILNIFIDFGGVLYKIDIQRTIDAFAGYSELTTDEIINMVGNPIFSEYERGEISTDQFRHRAKEIFQLNCTDEQFDDAWNATLISKIETSEAIINKFKKFGRVFLLSNTNELHLNKFRPECQRLFSLFDGLFFSHELGLSKPDPRIFQLVMEQTGSPVEYSVFIDDTRENTDAAGKLGMYALHLNFGSVSRFLHTVKFRAQECQLYEIRKETSPSACEPFIRQNTRE